MWVAETKGSPALADIGAAFYAFCFSTGSAIGPSVGSAIVDYIGFGGASFVFGCCMIVAWLVLLLLAFLGVLIDDTPRSRASIIGSVQQQPSSPKQKRSRTKRNMPVSPLSFTSKLLNGTRGLLDSEQT